MVNRTTVIGTIALILVGIILNVLVNYASTPVPRFLEKHPILIWVLIALLVIPLVALTMWQQGYRPSLHSRQRVSRSVSGDSSGMYKHDVFISYSSVNKDWVSGVLRPKLENHGFNVITDDDFSGGGLGVEEMARAVEQSKRVIAVVTRDFLNSKWTSFETAMAQTIDPDAAFRKLIPILREDMNYETIPLRIRILHHRDLTKGDTQEWERLIDDLI